MLLFIEMNCRFRTRPWCFNTSHVTLYPIEYIWFTVLFTFQYITCYSLSFTQPQQFTRVNVSIHHMLLFISEDSYLSSLEYPVSIHHMLLFIGNLSFAFSAVSWFQYITCYSLSGRIRSYELPRGVSIHHMLLFIRERRNRGFAGNHVSIHHMLLFITDAASFTKLHQRSFNTSHVTLYR